MRPPVTPGKLEVHHRAGLGSTRALGKSNGEVSATYGTDEFGVTDKRLTHGSRQQPVQYAGGRGSAPPASPVAPAAT